MRPISRRQFLQRGTLAAAATAAALASSIPRPAWANPLGKPIGLQLYTVADALEKDFRSTLRLISAIGYKEVEPAGYAGQSATQFRAALDAADLNCHSVHLQMNSPDLTSVFEDAHALGAHFVVCSAMFPPTAGSPPALDDYKKLAALLNDLGQKAERAKLRYAYHNHNFEFRLLENGKPGYDVLLAETDLWVQGYSILERGDCGAEFPGVGPPHVRHRPVAVRGPGLFRTELRGGDSIGGQGIQLDRNPL